jgi:intracellular sulfur oxidation DsrE/DsrF family protein
MKLKLMLLAVLGLATNLAFAQGADAPGNTVCPIDQQLEMDGEFGAGTSAITACNVHRHHIRVALSMGSGTLNPKAKINQVLVNVKNMVANYQTFYGLTAGDEGYQIAVVAHFQGGSALLNDEAYNRLVLKDPNGAGNPNTPAVQNLMAQGVHFIMCQNTMRGNGWKTSDLMSGVTEAPAGVAALTDFGMSGWVVLTP